MTTYIIRRLASSLVVIGVISAIVFIAVDASGDPAVLLAPMDALPEDVQALRGSLRIRPSSSITICKISSGGFERGTPIIQA